MELVKSGWILAVTKVEPAEFSGIRQRRGKSVFTMFSSHIRKNGVAVCKTRKEQIWGRQVYFEMLIRDAS